MGAHAGSRRCRNSSMARRRTRPLASSAAVVSRRTSPTTTTNNDAACGKARKASRLLRDAEVRRKMEALRRLVPSGGDEVDELLLCAAGYIARLQAQVTVMQLMVDVLEHTKDD